MFQYSGSVGLVPYANTSVRTTTVSFPWQARRSMALCGFLTFFGWFNYRNTEVWNHPGFRVKVPRVQSERMHDARVTFTVCVAEVVEAHMREVQAAGIFVFSGSFFGPVWNLMWSSCGTAVATGE